MAETTEQKGTNLLVALDGSDMCDHVIDWCAKHFSGKTDKIHMVHVVEYSLATVNPRTEFGLDYSELDEVNLATKVKQKAYNKGRKHLEKCGNRFASQGVKSVESKVLLAHPSKSVKGLLCEHADNLKPDVIVCGSRGQSSHRCPLHKHNLHSNVSSALGIVVWTIRQGVHGTVIPGECE
mmetsp:Transcript_11311/g.21700  ORF Transcript_11311/g.21700 Transcript_11311/m.21700 type:complete len:180 (-) Transcript_11311:97-636(-)